MPDAFQESHAFTLVEHRAALADIVGVLRDRGDANIHYRDGLELFGPADEPMLPDLLHPNGDGCAPPPPTSTPPFPSERGALVADELMGRRFAQLEFGPAGRLVPGRAAGGKL